MMGLALARRQGRVMAREFLRQVLTAERIGGSEASASGGVSGRPGLGGSTLRWITRYSHGWPGAALSEATVANPRKPPSRGW
jgi:hypothetical protein